MKILLIDDDVECLESLKLALESKGYQSQVFCDPEAAVNAYRFGDFDMVITDYKMPKMNGVEVLKAIRACNTDIRVIILTAFADTDSSHIHIFSHINSTLSALFITRFFRKSFPRRVIRRQVICILTCSIIHLSSRII